MPYIYLITSVFMSASSSVLGKIFIKKNDTKKDATIFYNFLLIISVFIGWGILYIIDFSFNANVLWYSVLFAVCYLAGYIGMINALKYGPAMLTSLFMGLSLLLTTLWGFLFWDEKITFPVVIGLILVVCAIVLCLCTREKDEKSFTWKWLFYIVLACLGNAGCSIVQRAQQLQYNGQHGNMLMFFAIGLSALTYLIIYLRSNREDTPTMFKTSWWLPISAGVCNLILNLFVMLMAVTELSPSLIYPVIGVGGLAVVTIFSLLVFKEKMRWWQWLGVAVGAVAVLLLSIG